MGILNLEILIREPEPAMTINSGLFKLDMIDHHAILGFSLAADFKQVRKRYLQIARQLHPDSLIDASEAQKQQASEFLSKQVNPAYEVLSQEKPAAEHRILLRMKQQQLVAQPALGTATSESARQLMTARNLEQDYATALQKIAAVQFDDLDQVESAINELSELNAVYLLRKAGEKNGAKSSGGTAYGIAREGAMGQVTDTKNSQQAGGQPSPPTAISTAGPSTTSTQTTPKTGIVQRYLSRAKEFEAQADYSRAILELREVIASYPKNASCQAYLASLYLKSGQSTLAKIHARQALIFDADNDLAKDVQSKLGISADQSGSAKSGSARQSETKGGKKGGLLSGLFGGKNDRCSKGIRTNRRPVAEICSRLMLSKSVGLKIV
ncbi:MAG: DnaJ domain-containing protein [Phormidesmis sp. RL_2_1]|nr:DnaJ domain-containing protein [Phormidesmis sp. RL_2_1]